MRTRTAWLLSLVSLGALISATYCYPEPMLLALIGMAELPVGFMFLLPLAIGGAITGAVLIWERANGEVL